MADVGKTVKKTKGYVDKAQAAAKKLGDAAAAAKKLQDTGATLSELQKATKALAFMSKVSAGLGGLSVALNVVQMFAPVKSQEDRIFDTLLDVQKDVKAMRQDLLDGFAAATKDREIKEDETDLLSSIKKIKTVYEGLTDVAVNKIERKPQHTIQTSIDNVAPGIASGSLKASIICIHDALTGTAISDNLLKDVADSNHADIRKVGEIANYLVQMTDWAVIGWGALSLAEERSRRSGDGRDFPEADQIQYIADLDELDSVHAHIVGIHAKCEEWTEYCLSQKGRDWAIPDFVEKKVEHWGLTADNFQSHADTIVNSMSGQWPWMNFTAIVYRGVSTYQSHAFYAKGGDFTLTKQFRVAPKDDNEGGYRHTVNIIVYGSPRKFPVVRPLQKTKHIVIPNNAALRLGREISEVDPILHRHWSGFVKFAQDVADVGKNEVDSMGVPMDGYGAPDLRTLQTMWPAYRDHKASAEAIVFPASDAGKALRKYLSDHWNGDMIWNCRFTGPRNYHTTITDMVAVATQNPALLYCPTHGEIRDDIDGPSSEWPEGVMTLLVAEEGDPGFSKSDLKKLGEFLKHVLDDDADPLSKHTKAIDVPDSLNSLHDVPIGPF